MKYIILILALSTQAQAFQLDTSMYQQQRTILDYSQGQPVNYQYQQQMIYEQQKANQLMQEQMEMERRQYRQQQIRNNYRPIYR